MSTTYAQLRTTIEARTGRTDLTDFLDEFISIAENMLRRDLRERLVETTETLNATSFSTALPDDFLMLKAISVDNEQAPELTYMPPAQVRENHRYFRGSIATYYSIEGGNLLVVPAPSPISPIGILITYAAELPGLSSSTSTNALSRVAWDLYLYATLFAAFSHIGDEASEAKYLDLYNSGMRDFLRQERLSRRAPGALRRKVEGRP